MGVEYSTFHATTAAVCKQCRTLNFPGCRNHKQLLSLPFGVEGIFTRCAGTRCDINTARSKFPCASCACKDHDIYRITLAEKETERVLNAFKHRCGVKHPQLVKLSTCMLICTECSAALFPIINDKLCVANSTGQLVDEAGQGVDLAMWQQHFVHCTDKCPGVKGRDFLARIDITLSHSELDYARKKIKSTPAGRWQDFKYTMGHVRMAGHGHGHGHGGPHPAAGLPASPPPASVRSNSIDSLSCLVDLGQTHPIAIGVCKKCMLVNFPGCAKHRMLLTKPYEVVDGRGKTTYAGCSVDGCEVNTRFGNYTCASCKGKDFSWYHVVLTDKESDYLLKAWQGRGLGFSANSKLSHSVTICNLCLCTGFPGAATKLCESRQGKLISPVTGAPMDVARWKDSHAHIQGCPGVGRVEVLMRVDMVLHGPEVQYLVQNIHAAPRGHWNPAIVRAGRYFDPAAAATAAPTSAGFPPLPYPPPSSAPSPYPQPFAGSGVYPYPTMPYPGYDPAMAPPHTPLPTMPYPSAGFPPVYHQNMAGSGAFPTGYPPAPLSEPLPPGSSFVLHPPPDASAYPFAAYAASMTTAAGVPPPMDMSASQPQSGTTTTAPYPYPYNPLAGQMPTVPPGAAVVPNHGTPSAPPEDSLAPKQAPAKGENEDESLCVICLCEKRDVIFYKCGHLAACHGCAQQMKNQQKGCPICRQPILDIVKVFNA